MYIIDFNEKNPTLNSRYFVFRAMKTRGKNMHIITQNGEVYLTIISTEGDIKIFEESLLLDKFKDSDLPKVGSDPKEPNLILDLGENFDIPLSGYYCQVHFSILVDNVHIFSPCFHSSENKVATTQSRIFFIKV